MIRKLLAILLGKVLTRTIKILKLGEGTAAPGLYALKVKPDLLQDFLGQLQNGSVVVSGTNGKTTTSRLISHYFTKNNVPYIHNREGSNLERGILSSCIKYSSLTGSLKKYEYALWEVDEAVLSKSLATIKPKIIVLLNLFRDQLDRYGEVDLTKNKWLSALTNLEYNFTLIYNGDDPQLVDLANRLRSIHPESTYKCFRLIDFHEQSDDSSIEDLLSPVDLVLCPRCKTKLSIKQQTITGMGQFFCVNCHFSNSQSCTSASSLSKDYNSTSGVIKHNDEEYKYLTKLQGTFNTYNFLASFTALSQLGYQPDEILSSLQDFTQVFGRMEIVSYKNVKILICLIKNPTGFTEMLKTVFNNEDKYSEAVFILNDNFADGTDVSWIWDVNLAKYIPCNLNRIYVTGQRAYDMKLRLLYSDIDKNKIVLEDDIEQTLGHISRNSETDSVVPVFATYTAMLKLQEHFKTIGMKTSYLGE
jgi:UDP-N-acetylmuramyl tripeptide synthase